MEPTWDEHLPEDPVFFSRDVYDKFSLTPSIKELWASLGSTKVKVTENEEGTENPGAPSNQEAKPKNNKNTPQNATASSSEPSTNQTEGQNDTNDGAAESENRDIHAVDNFLQPRVPYPCLSSLKKKDQQAYLRFLKNRNGPSPPQHLLERAKNEVAEFMRYLQDVSRICSEDYNYMSPGATRYSEEYLHACLDQVKNYPQIYLIQGITSLTGGKFFPDISLNFEKQLLSMGRIDVVENKVLPADAQLSVAYETVSSVNSPAKKVRYKHTDISTDSNAEKLCATYEPHVCLTKEAFVQLLSNDPEFTEAWELPVWVKTISGKGTNRRKTVYIDSPLLKTEMTQRERNLIFHEESIKVAVKKTGSKPVFFLKSEQRYTQLDASSTENKSRNPVSFDSTVIDFEMDLTELESFGESYELSKKAKKVNEPKALCKGDKKELSLSQTDSKKPTCSLTPAKNPPEPSETTPAPLTPAQEVEKGGADTSWTDVEDDGVEESSKVNLSPVSGEEQIGADSTEGEPAGLSPVKRKKDDSQQNSPTDMDSDEERLVIDDCSSPMKNHEKKSNTAQTTAQDPSPATLGSSDTITSPKHESTLDSPATPIQQPHPVTQPKADTGSPQNSGPRKGAKRARLSGECDQLGQILRMQDTLLKATPSRSQEPQKTQTTENSPAETRNVSRAQSLVKPCVTSFLESGECPAEDVKTVAISLAASPDHLTSTQKKSLLTEELQVTAEDEMDYEAPEKGNVIYKLYSLKDILLMVRSSVEMAHPRHDEDTYKVVPVHLLPKLEYQLCYGAESLTHSEACRLWAETLLHSSTVSFIGRINAHTSKLAQMQELPPDWIQNTSCDFKPVRSLNSLHHILKKVTELEEGRFLLTHKAKEAFVTVYKAADGKKGSHSAHDLQQVHSGPPGAPLHGGVPWVALDPLHVLPFHQKHGRPPCIFPPPDPHGQKAGGGKPGRQGPGRSPGPAQKPVPENSPATGPGLSNQTEVGNKKKKKSKGRRLKQKQKFFEKLRASKKSTQQKTPQPD
ncbi:little elongation complex subunit 2 [Chanos chanos]|uniref:Little elongation complex subunit 2 n=1 Tax=Chanos chanos TaxID=29144 RepID=A0A6J2ULJ4_CHACN|nr:little elongation complex subunit 2 [Chanos chanos]